MLEAILKEKKMTIYQCAKLSGIPYTTLSEVVRGKTRLEKCSAETVYKLSKVLNVTMEELMVDSIEATTLATGHSSSPRHDLPKRSSMLTKHRHRATEISRPYRPNPALSTLQRR